MHLLYMWLGLVGLTSSSDCLTMFGQVVLKDIEKTFGRRHNEKQ